MSITLILNVLLGIFFTWTLLSLAAMQIQEWTANKFKWRSRMLEKSIGKMLTDVTLLDQFYNHPLIRSLYTGKDNADKPSYIPASEFSQTMIDILAVTGTEASLLQQQLYKLYAQAGRLSRRKRSLARQRLSVMLGMVRKALVSESGEEACAEILATVQNDLLTLGQDIRRLQPHIENLFDTVRVQKQQINDALIKLTYAEDPATDVMMSKIKAGVAALSITQPQLKQSLQAILNSVPQTMWQKVNELELVRSNLEEWFNQTMDRLTGWYKRRCLVATLFVGILLAFFINVDSINLTTRLWREPDLRIAILERIENILTDDTTSIEGSQLLAIQSEFSGISLPVGWLGVPQDLQTDEATGLRVPCTLFPRQEEETYGLTMAGQCYPLVNTPPLHDLTGWLTKLAGILLSGIAASPGSSFWFDILKKIINVRLTGSNPAEVKAASVG